MQKVIIRPATPADLPSITRIYADAVVNGTATFEIEPPDQAEMTRRQAALLNNGYPYLTAEIEGVVAGYAYAGSYRARPAYNWSVEDSVYIAPDSHRKGIGGQLLAKLIVESEQRGFRQMIAVIGNSAQVGSIALHERAGFSHIARCARSASSTASGSTPCRCSARLEAAMRLRLSRHSEARARASKGKASYTTTRSERSSAPSTRSSSWPRRTICPVAEITLYAPWRRASFGFFSIR